MTIYIAGLKCGVIIIRILTQGRFSGAKEGHGAKFCLQFVPWGWTCNRALKAEKVIIPALPRRWGQWLQMTGA